MEPLVSIPNLPHFRANKPRLRGRGGDFTFTQGTHFFEQVPHQQVLLDLEHKTASTSLGIRRGTCPGVNAPSLGGGAGAPTAGFVANSGLVLQFEAYFKESVDESPLENHRVRKCRVLMYLEDSSMQIDEYKQENSGMPQGTLVKRHKIPYPRGTPGYYGVKDISVGATIDVYGRKFHVVDADAATRRFLRDRLGRFEEPAIPFPTDRYSVERKEFMSRQTGCDPTVQHKIVKNDMKMFAEATLGNTVDNSKRAGFIKYDRNVLRFQAVWDDRESLYGDIQHFELHYFLADDTIEIRAVHGPNSGRDPVPVLVKRGAIPKAALGAGGSEAYHWRDFDVGVELNVYQRPLLLVDADGHTRGFYESKGIRLAAPIIHEPSPEPVYEPPVFPSSVDSFTGGDDDDDLVSRSTSLIASPPRRIRGEDIALRYTAELRSNVPEDEGRRFIVTYFKTDRTVVVREPPKRNSGIMGGNFLSRMKVRDPSGNIITEACFYIGAEVTIHGHCFRFIEADDKTLRLMEERSANDFPYSDPVRAAELLSQWIDGRTEHLRALLRGLDAKGSGEASRVAYLEALSGVGVAFGPSAPEQVLVTLMRAVGGNARSAPYEKLVDRVQGSGGFQQGL